MYSGQEVYDANDSKTWLTLIGLIRITLPLIAPCQIDSLLVLAVTKETDQYAWQDSRRGLCCCSTPHGVTTQKTLTWISTAVKTSNFACLREVFSADEILMDRRRSNAYNSTMDIDLVADNGGEGPEEEEEEEEEEEADLQADNEYGSYYPHHLEDHDDYLEPLEKRSTSLFSSTPADLEAGGTSPPLTEDQQVFQFPLKSFQSIAHAWQVHTSICIRNLCLPPTEDQVFQFQSQFILDHLSRMMWVGIRNLTLPLMEDQYVSQNSVTIGIYTGSLISAHHS